MTGGVNAKKSRALIGYPILEKLIDSEDFSKVNPSMTSCYAQLERMGKNKTGGLSRQKKIHQILKAFDLTVDLIRVLLKTKYEMIEKNKIDKKKL